MQAFGASAKKLKIKFAITYKLRYFIYMKTKEQLLKDLAFWQDKVNRSRKESLRSIRVVHLQHVQGQLKELEESERHAQLQKVCPLPPFPSINL